MKQTCFSLAFFLALIATSHAQLTGGFKGGMNVSDLIVSNKGDYFEDASFESRASVHLGTYVQQTFAEHFAWQFEMQFSNKGYFLETTGSKSAVSLNYINWPVLIIYKPTPKLDLETGLEFGLLVTGDELFNNFDLGIDIGANYDISKKLNAGMRYNFGFPFDMNIATKESGTEPPQYQQSVFQVYIGFDLISE
jgi:hypothetical protein